MASEIFRYGSGYSSLNTLKDLLFDEVKIDRKFLGDTLTENARIVLQEVFHMLKRMGKSIVCEGVETQEIADFLQNEGCNEIQGFLYYRPMCQEDFEKLILKYFKVPLDFQQYSASCLHGKAQQESAIPAEEIPV